MGVAWPNPRFVDNSVATPADQTVTDKLTGLIWTKDAYLMKTRDPLFDVDLGQDGLVTWQQVGRVTLHQRDITMSAASQTVVFHDEAVQHNLQKLPVTMSASQNVARPFL
jgi:hypothetical protein